MWWSFILGLFIGIMLGVVIVAVAVLCWPLPEEDDGPES